MFMYLISWVAVVIQMLFLTIGVGKFDNFLIYFKY